MKSSEWWVYVLQSNTSGWTYVGCTTDVERRIREHNGELCGGAAATRMRRPWTLKASYGPYSSKSEALRVEASVKKLRGHARMKYKR